MRAFKHILAASLAVAGPLVCIGTVTIVQRRRWSKHRVVAPGTISTHGDTAFRGQSNPTPLRRVRPRSAEMAAIASAKVTGAHVPTTVAWLVGYEQQATDIEVPSAGI